jgi:hypothetical protein
LSQISVQLTKERENSQRRNAAPLDNGPTPERKAKLAGVEQITPPIDGTRGSITKAHVVQGVVEFYAGKWSYEDVEGARYLAQLWHKAASGGARVTGNYDGTPATAFGPRKGGVAAHTLDAHNQVLYVESILFKHFGRRGLSLVHWFLWSTQLIAREGAGMMEQVLAAGRSLAPWVKEEGRLWGITIGHLQAICHFSYANWVHGERAATRSRSPAQDTRERLNAKGMGAEQLQREVDKEIASTPKGLHVVKGGK